MGVGQPSDNAPLVMLLDDGTEVNLLPDSVVSRTVTDSDPAFPGTTTTTYEFTSTLSDRDLVRLMAASVISEVRWEAPSGIVWKEPLSSRTDGRAIPNAIRCIVFRDVDPDNSVFTED